MATKYPSNKWHVSVFYLFIFVPIFPQSSQFDFPWKHKKTSAFLMFPGSGVKWELWEKMGQGLREKKLTLRKKCPYSGFFWSVFSRNISPYSVRMRENKNQKNSEYGHFLRSVRI